MHRLCPKILIGLQSNPRSSQALRWSALFLGGGYGLFHQSSLKAQQKSAEIDHEYQRKENLIQQAKAAYVKKTLPKDKKTESGGSKFLHADEGVWDSSGD